MKKNESGDFSVLYIEPDDDKNELFPAIAGQKKPVILLLAEHVRMFQRPDDFTALKHIKRQHDLTVIFVIAHGVQMTQLAVKNGFPVYQSMDNLSDAVSAGQMARQRSLARPTIPLAERPAGISTRNTLPLAQPVQVDTFMREKPFSSPVERTESVRSHGSSSPLWPSPVADMISQPYPGQVLTQQRASVAIPPMLQTGPTSAPVPPQRRPKRFSAFLLVVTIAVLLGIIGSFLVFSHSFQTIASAPVVIANVGRFTFVSSGQVNETSSQGIADQAVLDLHDLPDPATGKKYYAWLLGDKSQNDPVSIALGSLNVSKGVAHLMYTGDAQHSNLLLLTSRVLVTSEDAAVPPMAPSLNMQDWRYYGEFSSTPINAADNVKHYSYLDHLRHLLGSDPTLEELELPGGLNNWLYRNTSKIVEWTGSMRETWEDTKDSAFIRRQTSRVLAYLDGTTFLSKDLPANSPLLVNERLARVGLLDVNGPNQQPPSYMFHITNHLRGLLQANSSSADLRKQINELTTSMSNVEFWLNQVHRDAQQLVKLNDVQMKQPQTLTLINDMISNASSALTGRIDPSTNQMREGVSWLHDHMQVLASIDLTAVKSKNSGFIPQIVPESVRPRAFVANEAKR